MGGYFGLMGAIKTGAFANVSTLDQLMREHLSAFSSANQDIIGNCKSPPLLPEMAEQPDGDQLLSQGDFLRRGAGSNVGRPKKNRILCHPSKLANRRVINNRPTAVSVTSKVTSKDRNANPLCFGSSTLQMPTLSLSSSCISGTKPFMLCLVVLPRFRQWSTGGRQRTRGVLGWPSSAKHMVIHRAFYDCDFPHHGTRYSQGPRVGDHIRNIIEVSFLTSPGCFVFEDSVGTNVFYYRASDVQQIIDENVTKRTKRLINKLKMSG